MTDAKKFLLLDPNNINRIAELFQQKNQRLQPIRMNEIQNLDTKMLEIINDQSLSEREKVAKYNSTLTEFQTISKEKVVPVQHPKTKKEGTVIKDEYNELVGIPKIYQNKANNLLKLLKTSKKLQISDRGEVSIGKEQLKGSNISDFLNKAVNPNAKSQSLAGWAQFQSLLKDSNVPQTLLHKNLKKELDVAPKQSKKSKGKSPKTSKLDFKWEPYK